MRRTITLGGLLLAGLLAWSVSIAEPPAPEPAGGFVAGQEGIFKSGPWTYQYRISGKGTRSEGQHGHLSYNDKVITAENRNDRINTPWGIMYWHQSRVIFGEHGWMVKPVANQPEGKLIPDPNWGPGAAASQPTSQPGGKPMVIGAESNGKTGELVDLIAQLDNQNFKIREAATEKLISIGEPNRPALEAKLKDADLSPEVAMRIHRVLKMIGVLDLDPGDFDKLISTPDKPVLIDFYKVGAAPCTLLDPVMDKLAGEYCGKVVVAKCMLMTGTFTVTSPQLKDQFQINFFPTVILFVNGQPKDRFSMVYDADKYRQAMNMAVGGPTTQPASQPEGKPMVIGTESNGKTIAVKPGQDLVVRLKGNPTTGFRWDFSTVTTHVMYKAAPMVTVGEVAYQADPAPAKMVGSGGMFVAKFRAVAVGQSVLTLVYRRPWEKEIAPAEIFTVTVDVK